ncbi:hypothetical protein OPQ81_010570 [Rhizoctonia solani]|nr:hypothetical protein OPQ81_010570 [Rhizoctonia solani]
MQTNVTAPVANPTSTQGAQAKSKKKGKPDPIRFTIPVGDVIPINKWLPEFEIYNKVQAIIDIRSNSIGGKLTEVKWNAQGNLMLTFTHSTNVNAVQAIAGEIRDALRLEGAGELRRAVPWGKVCISGVATGMLSGDRNPHSKDALLHKLYYSNNFLKNYAITQGPDWTIPPSRISMAYASISFAFEDKDGKLLPQLLKSNIHMWGKSITLNVAGSPARVHAILNNNAYDFFDIILIQDPWWGKIGSEKSVSRTDDPIYGTTHSPQWHCYHPPIGHSQSGPGVVTYVRKGVPGLSCRFSDKIPMSCNLIPIDFIYLDLPFTISNIYLHGPTANQTLLGLLDAPADASEAHIYCGDFNLHHPQWALSYNPVTTSSANSDMLAEWITMNQMEILNALDVPTRVGRRGQRDSIIDLTIANEAVLEGDLVSDWECSSRGTLGSDHNCITWANEDKWTKAVLDHLENHPPPPQYLCELDIEEGALAILKAMSAATEQSMQKVPVNKALPRSPWWNDQCSQAVADLENCGNPDARSKALGHLRSAIRGARRSHGDKLCSKVASPEAMFKITNWYKGKCEAPLPPPES